MRIDLGSLVFNDAADVNGVNWYVTAMEGWDAPNIRQSFAAPASQHGAVALESMLDTRSLVLRGIVKAPTEETFWGAYNYLSGLPSLWVPIPLVVHESTPKQSNVIRGGLVRQNLVGVRAFEFEIPLIAQDPRKYATADTEVVIDPGSSATLTNNGQFATNPVVEVVSSGTVILTNTTTGQQIATASLPSGAVIDFHRHSIVSGGLNLYSTLVPASMWWSLQPGANNISNSGSAQVRVTYRHAWI